MISTKPFLLLVAALFCLGRAEAQLGYGAELGLGMSNMHFAPDIGFTSASKKPSFSGKFGVLLDVGIDKHIYFQTGLFCSLKGHQRTFSFHHSDSLNEAVDQTLQLVYADLPLNLCFKTSHQGKGRVIMGIGATPSYLIGGKNKLSAAGVDSGTFFTRHIDNAVTPGHPINGFDIGINLFAGYELPTGWLFRAYYTAGVNDLGLGSEIDKNRMWGVSIGYLFGKGRNINKEADDLIDRTKD